MYSEITNGSKFNVQGLECNIPAPGYVYNITRGEVEYCGIYSRSENPEEQYWERSPLPDWYKQKLREETVYNKHRKVDDPPYYDEQLESYTRTEWFRRLNGFWFMNHGYPVYITGSHYLFMQWWMLDMGYPKFRFPDLEYFYFLQYCIEDPYCMGMLEITKRRFGKSFRGGLFLYEYTTRTREAMAGIQSKTGKDAKKMFGKCVVKPFKKLPRFFRPEYDMSLGITPKTEIRFQQTNIRGKEAEQFLDKEDLGSLIDFESADVLAYDGQKQHRYFGDEWAKTVEADIYDRHETIRYCLMDDEGHIIGKALYSSTVEQLETEKDGVQKAAIKLWDDSNQLDKGEDGRTISGLYRFFMTADRAKNFDKYGVPDVTKTVKEILMDRAKVRNPKVLAARIRKEARTIQEAFYAGNSNCEFNSQELADWIRELELEGVNKDNNKYLRRMRLIKKDKIIKSIFPGKPEVTKRFAGAMDDQNGAWYILEPPNEENKNTQQGEFLFPNNTGMYIIGVDTVKDLDALEGSEPVALVMKQSCIIDGVETGLMPVAMRISDTRLGVHFDEEVALACMWYGCKACYEIDARDDYYRYFNGQKMRPFLHWTPTALRSPTNKNDKLEPGVRSGNPFQLYQQLQICKTYVDGDSATHYNGNIRRIKFYTLLQQLLDYNHADRKKSDQVIALMMALTTMLGAQNKPKKIDNSRIKILPTYKIKMV